MKKNIVIGLLIVVTVFSSVYAFIEQTRAMEAQKQAEINLELALTAQKQADMNAAEAIRQQHLADQQTVLLAHQIQECKKKN